MALKDKVDHPSYGVVSLSRFSTTGITLFDSPFRHHHGIMLKISRAYKTRELHEDRIFEGDELIRVSMSEVQFANLITSANVGCGTPCTLERVNGQSVEDAPQENMRETFKGDIKNAFKDLSGAANELEGLVNKKDAKADDRKKMRDLASQIAMAFRDNLAFMQEQFEEQLEKAVSAARAEIQAHVEHVVKKAGVQAMEKESFKLEM